MSDRCDREVFERGIPMMLVDTGEQAFIVKASPGEGSTGTP